MNKVIKEKKKINWLLILQGWTMLWVVIGHAFLGEAGSGPSWENALFHFAYSFHMPLFMFISGWLFYKTRLNSMVQGATNKWTPALIIKDKTLRLLIPGLFFSIIAYCLKLTFPGAVSRQTSFTLNDIIHSYLYPIENPFLELWFIAVLFVFFLLSPMWKYVVEERIRILLMLVVLLVVHYVHPQTTLLSIDRICEHAIWFYLGIIVSKFEIVETHICKLPWLTLVFGVLLYLVGYFTVPLITTIGGIVLSLGIAQIADTFMPQLFFSFRNYTYQIFLMGIFAQMLVKIMYRLVSIPYVVAFLLCVLMGLYVPVLVSKLIVKINWKPFSICVGLK